MSCLAPPLASNFASHMLTTPFPAPKSADGLLAADDDDAALDDPEATGVLLMFAAAAAALFLTALEIFQLPQGTGGMEVSMV